MSLEEYEAQLAEVEELLEASPEEDHESLLKLKTDVLELIALTKADVADDGREEGQQEQNPSDGYTDTSPSPPVKEETEESAQTDSAAATISEEKAPAVAAKKPSSTSSGGKLKKVKDFEVPTHLQPHETDTEGERNKKRRAVKTMKSKWREKKKNYESDKKQQSWQNFNTKSKKRKKEKSIFATQDGTNSKVGVVSGGSLSEIQHRKRHKH